MKKNTKKAWVVVFSIAIIAVICVLGALCWYLLGLYNSGKENDGLKDKVLVSSSAAETIDVANKPSSSVTESFSSTSTDNNNTSSKKDTSSSKPKEEKTIINNGVNFTELWKLNTDVYAWLRVPNTVIDYPLLQYSGDDSFYLEHNIYKQYSFAGSIYTEKLNSKDFDDPNTLIYGHNLLNGTMFAALHNFRDPNFFASTEFFYIYTPEETLTYQIFAAYEYDDRHILYSFDFNDTEVYQDYLDYACNPENSMTYNTRDIAVTTDDTIVTLSTCMDAIATSRYLVQGVLISREPATP